MLFKSEFDKLEVKNEILEKMKVRNTTHFVTHNCCLDGTLSGLFCKHYLGLEIGGIFKVRSQSSHYSNLAYCGDSKLDTMLFVDCSISNNRKLCIDHHAMMEQFYHKNNYNVNKFSVYSNSFIPRNFFHKNPTGNILWMLYLWNIDVSKFTEGQQLLLCMADGLYECYLNEDFRDNVIQWLHAFGQECLIDVLSKDNIVDLVKQGRTYLGITDDAYITYCKDRKDWYCCNKWGNIVIETKAQELYDNIAEIMEWDKVIIPKMYKVDLFVNKKEPLWKANRIVNGDLKHATSAIVSLRQQEMLMSYFDRRVEFDKCVDF